MVFFIISIIFLSISIFLFIKIKDRVNNNKEIEKEEKEIQRRIDKKIIEEREITDRVSNISQRLNEFQQTLDNQKIILDSSLSQYAELLDWQYKKEEK